MFNSISKRSIIALLAAFAVISAGVGPAMAATPTIDTETTNTTTTSDWQEGTTVSGFEANASNYSNVEVSFDAAPDGTPTLEVLDKSSSDNRSKMDVVLTNASAEETAATNGYLWNVSHGELEDLPVNANSQKTVLVKVYDDGDEANAQYLNVTLATTDARSLTILDNSAADEDGTDLVSFVNKHAYFSKLGISAFGLSDKSATVELEDLNSSANTTHTFALTNETTANSFANATGDVSDGAWLPDQTVKAEDADGNTVYVPVFLNEKSDAWDFLDSDEAYAVYNSDENEMTVHMAGDERFDGIEQTTLTMTGDQSIGFSNAYSMFGDLGASSTQSVSNALSVWF